MSVRRLAKGDRLVVASHNKGKVREFSDLFLPYGLIVLSAHELALSEPEETASDFEGNAKIKAVAAARSSGLPALADDSGLVVEALDGAPGVFSARWAGETKDFDAAMLLVKEKLEAQGAWSAPDQPQANFTCVLCLAWPDGDVRFFNGRVDGYLVWPPRGGNGFGYDPMFVPTGQRQTFGEMAAEAKHAGSHRARAFESFVRGVLDGG